MSDERPKHAPRAAPPAAGPPELGRATPGPPAAPAPQGAQPRAPGATYGLAARVVGADAALAAGLEQEGSLARESALHLFFLAAAVQATGRLTLSAEGRRYALSFRRGAIAHAASSDPDEDLGRFLVRRGALSEAQRAQAERAKARAGDDLAAALVADRVVNPADVAGLLQEHGAALVQRALAVEEGGWAWAPNAPLPPSSFPLGAPLAMLCQAVRALDAAALARRLGEREHRTAARVGGRVRLEDLRLTPQEARAVQLFDGARSPAELAAASPVDAIVVLRLALLLAECELLAFGAPRRAPGPAAARPAPPAEPGRPAAGPQGGAPARPAPARAPAPQARAAAAPGPASTAAPRPAPPPLEPAALEALVARLREADHFQVLGLRRDAAGPQIKAAYFQLAKIYHPDAVAVGTAPEVRKLCADVFTKVSEAWSVLGEDASRAAYLDLLAAGGPASLDVENVFRAENAFQAGTLLARSRRYVEALARFEEAIRLNPQEAEFSMWRAWCEFLLGADRKEGLATSGAAVEAALRQNPRCAQGYLFLGQMAKLAGEVALAERHLRRGLEVAPEHAELQRELKYLRK